MQGGAGKSKSDCRMSGVCVLINNITICVVMKAGRIRMHMLSRGPAVAEPGPRGLYYEPSTTGYLAVHVHL